MTLRTVAAALAALSLVLLAVVQFVPWASFEQSGFGGSAKVTVRTWEGESSGSFAGFSGSDTHGWYSGDADDAEGVDQIRIAIPLLLGATLLALVGTILGFATRGASGPVVILVAGLAAAAGTALFALGTDAFFEDADYDWLAAFYMSIVAAALLLVGGVLGLVGGNRQAVA